MAKPRDGSFEWSVRDNPRWTEPWDLRWIAPNGFNEEQSKIIFDAIIKLYDLEFRIQKKEARKYAKKRNA